MDIQVPGLEKTSNATPVRRRESTINNRRFQGDHEQEWTGARCHRLLRGLTSRVAILNKEFANFSSGAQNENDQGREILRTKSGAAKPTGDADWARSRNRIRQTYSRKSTRKDSVPLLNGQNSREFLSTKRRRPLVPGEVTIPTPILARARGELPTEPVPTIPRTVMHENPVRRNKRSRTRYVAKDGESKFQLSESLLDLRRRIAADRYTIYEGIYSGLEALLRATNMVEQKRKGTSSLLSISLRTIPRYITQQEALLRVYMEDTGSKSAIESRDISTEIYGELETFGSSGHGWRWLRVIVRSHGIQVLSDAIHAGLLDVEFSGALIALCVNTSAIDEAQTLLSALLSSRPFPVPKTPYDILNRRLTMLWKFTEHTGRSSFQYKQLFDIVSNQILPVEWLATKEFGPIWTGVIHSLSPSSGNVEAMMFLELTLTLLSVAGTCSIREKSGAITEAVNNTFCSLLTTLTSIVILNRGVGNPSPTKGAGSTNEYAHVSSLLGGCLVQQNPPSHSLDRQSHLILLANLLVCDEHLSTDSDGSLIGSLLHHLIRRENGFGTGAAVYTSVVEFICLVARCCGRGVSSSGFEHLEHLHLIIKSFIYGTEGANILKGLIVDSAFAFAHQVPDRKHIDYATVMDEKFCARRFEAESSLAVSASHWQDARSGYRWEEGIGEWVTATPAIQGSRKIVQDTTDSEDDTPFRPPKLRRRRGLANESSRILPSPLFKESLDYYEDVRDLSKQTSNSGLDEPDVGSDGDDSMSHGSSPRKDDDSPRLHQSTGSAAEIEASNHEGTFVSDSLSLFVTPDSPRSSKRCETLTPKPTISRRLFSKNRDWNLFEDCSVSSSSSQRIERNVSTDVRRDYVERVPRLGRRALLSSQAWQIFDEIDDELSFLSVPCRGDHVLQDITNTAVSSTRRLRQANPPLTQKISARSREITNSNSDSEDELCI